ncbi:DoxX family protein [Actinokineospora guangxiensis]|uniref:DoxX family protein n=1 Tax=Actinokineospora guangxiensis TaxID=1490288 RepID=A0ABW0EVK0_9PSEU
MDTVLWVIAWVLAAVFLGGGLAKVVQPREKLVAMGLAWAEDFSPGMIRLIGVLEVLAAIGLVLPALLDIAPVFVPLAAVGLVLVMAGAIVVHVRRKEMPQVAANVVLLALAAVVAWGRFGPYAF